MTVKEIKGIAKEMGLKAGKMKKAEMIRMILVAIKGITITDETLSMDVIHEVGPGGAYITHDHSLKSMRSQSQSKLFDRRSRSDWMEMTRGEAVQERAYEAAIEILKTHEACPLPDGASKTMRKIVKEFEKEIEMNPKKSPQKALQD